MAAPSSPPSRSPSTPAFAFGVEARSTGRRRGFASAARSEDEESDFELESFPLTRLALGPWHARAHVSLRLFFGRRRFVFVVVRRLRAQKPSAFGRTAELVARGVARRLRVDVPRSPFDLDARNAGRAGHDPRVLDASPEPEPEPEPSFAEGARGDVSARAARLRRRRGKDDARAPRVLTYAIEHDDVCGVNYLNPLCVDGRLVIETRRVTKRAFATLDEALASLSGEASTAETPSRAKPSPVRDARETGVAADAPGDFFDRRRTRGAVGIGRAGARRADAAVSPGARADAAPSPKARKRSRFTADARVRNPRTPEASGGTGDAKDAVDGPVDGSVDGSVDGFAETSDAPSPSTPPRRDGADARRSARHEASRSSEDESPAPSADRGGARETRRSGATTFRHQTVFACFDDPRLPDALRAVVTSERRLLTLVEDGIPVWATAMASCGVYYRPWLRIAARAAFVAVALVSAWVGARDAFRAAASASANTLVLGGLAWHGGARLGFVDSRAVRALTAVAHAAARALARVLAFVGYVVSRLVSHRLSLAMAARRAWRGLPGLLASAHGFVVGPETRSGTETVEATEREATGATFLASVAGPRRRKPETPARGARARVADDDST